MSWFDDLMQPIGGGLAMIPRLGNAGLAELSRFGLAGPGLPPIPGLPAQKGAFSPVPAPLTGPAGVASGPMGMPAPAGAPAGGGGMTQPQQSPYALAQQQRSQASQLNASSKQAQYGGGTAYWRAAIDRIAAEEGVDPDLVEAVMEAESNGNAQAKSYAGAIGLMQLMPDTARGLGVNPFDPYDNIRGGARYLSRMMRQFGGDVTKALAAYNAGPGNVPHWQQIAETRAYVPKVMGLYSLRRGAAGDRVAAHPQTQAAVGEAMQQIGRPYTWGGTTPGGGFDCSGLVLYAFARAGIALPRTAQQQFDATERINPNDARAGDLIFFTGTDGRSGEFITHVGIYLGNGQMLNAPQPGQAVRVVDLSTAYWQQHWAGYGRVRSQA